MSTPNTTSIATVGVVVTLGMITRQLLLFRNNKKIIENDSSPPNNSFIPKTILITGAGSGLGKATTIALLDHGHSVVAADVDVNALWKLEQQTKSKKGLLITLVMNVSNPTSVQEAALRLKRFASTSQCLDCIINYAGVLRGGPLIEMDDIDFISALNINVLGTFLVNKYFFPLLKRDNGNSTMLSKIINVGSEVSWAGVSAAFNAPYGITKMAVEMYTTGLRQELNFLKPSVHVTILNPGAFITEMTDHGTDAFEKASKKQGTLFYSQLVKGSKVAQAVIQRNKLPATILANKVLEIVESHRPPPQRVIINLSWEMFFARYTPQWILDFALPIVMAIS
jgi:3-oxoacyl-[acyl-carrier protein] reductase